MARHAATSWMEMQCGAVAREPHDAPSREGEKQKKRRGGGKVSKKAPPKEKDHEKGKTLGWSRLHLLLFALEFHACGEQERCAPPPLLFPLAVSRVEREKIVLGFAKNVVVSQDVHPVNLL